MGSTLLVNCRTLSNAGLCYAPIWSVKGNARRNPLAVEKKIRHYEAEYKDTGMRRILATPGRSSNISTISVDTLSGLFPSQSPFLPHQMLLFLP